MTARDPERSASSGSEGRQRHGQRHRSQVTPQVVQGRLSSGRCQLQRSEGDGLCPAGQQRRRQDHDDQHPDHPHQGRWRHGHGGRSRRCRATGQGAQGDQPDGAVRCRRQPADGPREPAADRRPAPRRRSRRDRHGPVAAVRVGGGGRSPRVDVLRRDAPPPRHRHEPDRQSCGHLPGRAHHRVRPGGPQRDVADDPRAGRGRDDGVPHDAVSRRGRRAGRRHRGPAPGPDRRRWNGRRAEEARAGRADRADLPRRRDPRCCRKGPRQELRLSSRARERR